MKIYTKTANLQDVTTSKNLQLYERNALAQNKYLFVSDNGIILNDYIPEGETWEMPEFSDLLQVKWNEPEMLRPVLRTNEEYEYAKREVLYLQKYEKHKGKRWYLYCDYDEAYSNEVIRATLFYLVPRKDSDVLTYTINTVTEQDEHGEIKTYNKCEIFSDRIAPEEWAVINAFPEIIKGIEDLETFKP